MVEFKKSVKKVLPYDRRLYIEFFDDDFESSIQWYGISLQLNSEKGKLDFAAFVEVFDSVFKNIILKLDNGSFWIVNHDDKDLEWFPNDDDNLNLLRNLFKQNNVPNTYRGALVLATDDLLELSKDLISYPYGLFYKKGTLYKNLDISHGELQFIIKISGHLTIDLLSTDKMLLRKVISENTISSFNIKEYRGSSLWL